jgi:hypothetical protein
MKVIFLDNDGVICLSSNWGSRYKKQKKFYTYENPRPLQSEVPVHLRFDNFDRKAIKILNEILTETGAEIVVSSDWRLHANLEELGEYYKEQGIIKKPIALTLTLGSCNTPSNFVWSKDYDLEQCRSLEIKQFLEDHKEITHWVAVDDLDMSERFGDFTGNYQWGLKNFVLTPRSYEGIKQCGIKEKIKNFLK